MECTRGTKGERNEMTSRINELKEEIGKLRASLKTNKSEPYSKKLLMIYQAELKGITQERIRCLKDELMFLTNINVSLDRYISIKGEKHFVLNLMKPRIDKITKELESLK